jgi:16S rRNA (cytosine1402-N4)-methyltransferase
VIVHEPVLLAECLELLVPPAGGGGLMVDATLGQAGHAEAFLDRWPNLALVGVDADAASLETARARLARFGDRVELVNAWFAAFFAAWTRDRAPDLVLFDLGISRFHYEMSGRGFSFDRDEPLDMRLSADLPVSAADLVNGSGAAELADVLFRLGGERYARLIAARIVRERARTPIATAARLADVVRSAVPPSYRHGRIHPATRTFQALRIAVNHELEQLEQGLASAFRVLAPGGRIGVISFHSLEDGTVKRFFRERSRDCTCPPEFPVCRCGGRRELILVTPKAVPPGDAEVARNPASRSAHLRVAEKEAA